jgi:hypothetical protein
LLWLYSITAAGFLQATGSCHFLISIGIPTGTSLKKLLTKRQIDANMNIVFKADERQSFS